MDEKSVDWCKRRHLFPLFVFGVCVVFVFNGLLSGVAVMCLMVLGVGDVAKTNNNGIDEWMGVVCG